MTKPAAQNNVVSDDVVSPAEPEMAIYVTNAVRTSKGPGPGPMMLPVSEANAIISMKYGVAGSRNPAEATGPEPTTRRFGSLPASRPAQSN